MTTRSKLPFDDELEKLEVVLARDLFIKFWRKDFQKALRRASFLTINWLENEYDQKLINSFRLPLTNLFRGYFRKLYVQAFELGLGSRKGVPLGILYIRADIASDLFVNKIETDLKRVWKRQISKDVRLKQTIEVFKNAVS